MQTRHLSMVLAALALAVGAPPASPQEAGAPELGKRITLEHRGKFQDFVGRLRTSLGVNIYVSPLAKELVDPDAEQEIMLRDVTGATALRWVTELYGLDYAVQGGMVVIGRREWLSAPVLRRYDIRPLQAMPKDSRGPKVVLQQPAPAVGFVVTQEETSESPFGHEMLIDLIKENVHPGAWEGATTIERTLEQGIAVSSPPAVQDDVARFLESLGQLSPPMVTVTAEILDADDGSMPAVGSGVPLLFSAKDLDGVMDRLKGARRSTSGRVLQTSGTAGQRLHSILVDEAAAVEGVKGKDEVIATGIHGVSVLDCRPVVVGDGASISVEFRLTIGQSTDLEPLKVRASELAFREGSLTKLTTTALVPNGGGALFALPARATASKRGQLCLLRASTDPAPPLAPRTIHHGPDRPSDPGLLERLRKVPPVTVDLEDAPFDDFLKWLRAASGMNVVADQDRQGRVTVHGKNLSLESVLTLVLQPHHKAWLLRDEALQITSADRSRKMVSRVLADVRDVAYGVEDFQRESNDDPVRQAFTGEDLANLIKNTVHKDQWEEADGKSIQFYQGILIIRNTPEMIQHCLRFVEESRRARLRTVALRADLLVVPAAAADPILGRAGGDSYLIDATQADALARAGTFQERLGWTSFESQRTSMSWNRSLGFLRDWTESDDPVLDTFPTQSSLEVRPTLSGDGRSVTLDLSFEDRRVVEIFAKKIRELTVQSPLSTGVQMKTMLRIPNDKLAVFKWSVPAKGADRQYRLLIVKPTISREGN